MIRPLRPIALAILLLGLFAAACELDTGTPQSGALGQYGPCTVTPASIDFDTVAVGRSSAPATFRATNESPITAVGTFQTRSVQHFQANDQGYFLGQFESRDFTVSFVPESAGRHSWSPFCGLSLTGVGVIACVFPAVYDFGGVRIGESADTTFAITNTTSRTLTGTVELSCPHYSLLSGGGAYILPVGEARWVGVRFQPTEPGWHWCTVETGDTLCSDVRLRGRGDS